MVSVSIIMPTYNKAEYLDLTLSTFLAQTYRNFEIVIVNDGSADDTEAVVKRHENLNIKYISCANSGRSAARNTGVNAARGEIVIFCDDDRLVSPTFIQAHVEALRTKPQSVILGLKRRVLTIWQRGRLPLEHHEWLAVASRTAGLATRMEQSHKASLVNSDDLIENFDASIEQILIGDEPDNNLPVLKARNFDLTGLHLAWAFGTTANMAVLRKYLAGEPAFDEAYRGWGLEDTDLTYRLHLKGLGIRFAANAINYHQVHPLGGSSRHDDARERALDYSNNLRYFCNKFRTLETYLFWRCQNNLSILAANALLDHMTTSPAVQDEIVWAYQELLRTYDTAFAEGMSAGVLSGQHLVGSTNIAASNRQKISAAA